MNHTFPSPDLWSSDPFYCQALVALLVSGALAAGLLSFITAPYGRYHREGWGPSVPARWAWVVMEAPSPIGFAAVWWSAPGPTSTAAAVLGALYLLHYVERSFIYPLRMRGGDKPKPVLTAVLAFVFNVLNGSLNAYALYWLADHLDEGWLADPRFGIGLVIFAVGYVINRHADHILRNLRAPGETGYKIPYGGAFRWVSGANYLGEIIEWFGFAIAAWTAPAWVFAVFTLSNIGPRAISHHRWYREHFPDYPPERRALVPFVL
jgi:3-oxo-5-alpha-steroid 4-dehydrogenase 1